MPVRANREYRNMEMRVLGDSTDERIVTGYASTFDEPYELFSGDGYRFMEVVERGAFDSTDMSDVIMQYNHAGRVFARTRNNTLEVRQDDRGLFIRADLGGTDIGRQLYEEIDGGYTDRMSFGFTVNGEWEESEKTPEGVRIWTRHITSVEKLYDVSAVSFPANEGTSIEADATVRSIGELTDGVIEKFKAELLSEQRLDVERRLAEIRAKGL